ncbi:MAG: hypothetical protein LLG20_10680 [Acidobacteriales bacterium]|nr:hypothetical protein [Terriglobales bacterium]
MPKALWLLIAACLLEFPASAADPRPRVYSHLLNPREHPDDTRRHVQPPDWNTFGNRTQFTSLRSFEVSDGRIVRYTEEIEKYTRTLELGDVIWPSYPIIFASNLGDLADEINRRGLFLFDIWGYVPGSGPGGYWQQFQPPAGVFPMLESKLGRRWLGMDVGEQDGRYVGGYAKLLWPPDAPRFEQYLNFQRFFERMTNDLGSRMSALVSLNFGHYFLKEGLYTLLGAETAQALPNSQVYYAFIRGAGKQYGVPWFGNASVFNRWGFKNYGPQGKSDGFAHGPAKGTSLSLMKRLMYSHILYNSMIVGFESGWIENNELTPIGSIQRAANRWVKNNGQPGVMQTPIALMVDFYSGWSFPRHLYTSDVYRVWGNLPYERGDYLTHGVLDMLYPGYESSSYFHDETGFLTATPYGDSADVLLSDAPGWLLDRYPLLVLAGDLQIDEELRDKLRAYVANGGRLVIPGTLARRAKLDFAHVALPGDFGMAASGGAPAKGAVDTPLPNPCPLLEETRAILDREFRAQTLFEAGDGLSVIVCRRAPRDYTVGIANNTLHPLPFAIRSRIGRIASVRELPLDQSEKGAAGQLPEGFEKAATGSSDAETIAGGDVRIFRVALHEENVIETKHAVPPARPRDRILTLRGLRPIKEEILARPTFFQHFDGIVVDWKYLHDRTGEALARESRWINLQNLRVMVDLSSGINLYPDLRLVDNIRSEHEASLAVIQDVLSKMKILGAKDLILALDRVPETNITSKATWESWEATLRRIAADARAQGVTLHLRVAPTRPASKVADAVALLERVNAPNLRLAEANPEIPPRWLGLWTLRSREIATKPPALVPVVFDAVYANHDEEYLHRKRLPNAVE